MFVETKHILPEVAVRTGIVDRSAAARDATRGGFVQVTDLSIMSSDADELGVHSSHR